MSPKKDTHKSIRRAATTGKAAGGFTDEERAAMKARAQELKAEARANKHKAAGENAVLAAIAAMKEPDRAMAKRLHALVKASAPSLLPKTWYGMPAYANQDGKVVCFFQAAQKFKARYTTFGLNDTAHLDLVTLFATAEVDGEKLPIMDVLAYCLIIVVAGNETTRNAMTGGMLALLEHPGEWKRLQDDEALLAPAIEEIVRWTTPVIQFCRTTTEDFTLRGQQIRAGQSMCLFYPSANRDEEIFPDGTCSGSTASRTTTSDSAAASTSVWARTSRASRSAPCSRSCGGAWCGRRWQAPWTGCAPLAEKDPEILSIHMTAGLSGTFNSAIAGAEMVPEAKITHVNTKTLSAAARWQVKAAAYATKAGWTLDKILPMLQKISDASESIYTLEELNYLIHGGRISQMKGLIASLLNIMPMIGMEKVNGTYVQQGQARNFRVRSRGWWIRCCWSTRRAQNCMCRCCTRSTPRGAPCCVR